MRLGNISDEIHLTRHRVSCVQMAFGRLYIQNLFIFPGKLTAGHRHSEPWRFACFYEGAERNKANVLKMEHFGKAFKETGTKSVLLECGSRSDVVLAQRNWTNINRGSEGDMCVLSFWWSVFPVSENSDRWPHVSTYLIFNCFYAIVCWKMLFNVSGDTNTPTVLLSHL